MSLLLTFNDDLSSRFSIGTIINFNINFIINLLENYCFGTLRPRYKSKVTIFSY
jgi:hypothetical protein